MTTTRTRTTDGAAPGVSSRPPAARAGIAVAVAADVTLALLMVAAAVLVLPRRAR